MSSSLHFLTEILSEKCIADSSMPFVNQMASPKLSPALSEITVLVVDDVPDILSVAGLLLSSMGLKVVMASGGIEARAVLEGPEQINVLIADIYMPFLSGLELAREVETRHPELPVILMSGSTLPPEALPLPAHWQYLSKPFTSMQLRRAVLRAL